MTLIITLAAPWAIHQSSDYRLTFGNGPRDDAASKHLSFICDGLMAQVCFTGVAQVRLGSPMTIDWISEIITQAQGMNFSDIDEIASRIATRGSQSVSGLPVSSRMLTVVIAVMERGKEPRLVMASNCERFDSPRTSSKTNLEVTSIKVTEPRLFTFGWDIAVPDNDRNDLIKLLRSDSENGVIQEAIADVNKRVAENPASQGYISKECMVSSLRPNLRSHSMNFGLTPGNPHILLGGTDFSQIVKTLLPPGKLIAIRQTAGVSATANELRPDPPPEGEPRTFNFVTPTSSRTGIVSKFGGKLDKLIIEGMTGSVKLRKNEWVSATINIVTWEAGEPARISNDSSPWPPWLTLPNRPSIDGVQPASWDYSFDVALGPETNTLHIRKMSTALISTLEKPLAVLEPTEWFEMVAPKDGLTLIANVGEKSITGTIEALFHIRDSPDVKR